MPLLDPDADRHYKFLGTIVGRALRAEMLVDLTFCNFFLTQILGGRVSLNELRDLDAELYQNLVQVKDYAGDVSELDLTFTVAGSEVTGHRLYNLVPDGANVAVTNENRIRYVYHMADFYLRRRTRQQIVAFQQGLEQAVPAALLRLFAPAELRKLIRGEKQVIDVEEFRRHVVYNGFRADDVPIQLFWSVVHEMDNDAREQLLRFITSCPRPPILGFQAMHPRIAIANSQDPSRLPSAATCMNLLKLPPYTSREILKDRLYKAIYETEGFGLS
ncbi:uncharacterized protein MONBRDRAFT_30034 [Monosiga brevicollis MX1]|uniref:HECT-type E3 ubiquitin transferase n=1 Tax=Monosiga brevicollis TaxID=81824 RepID=A9VCU1_MONBE|nr:uncharacterized protein MONBRDRAFT_30034 [Monosiga brevicollis MX1]EDQ84653.1 predicted protein [Monosiga brevicollis MX1]|eukprot:XP_001750557.1 hypothetical protein [Monosiga brevicollis MX1]